MEFNAGCGAPPDLAKQRKKDMSRGTFNIQGHSLEERQDSSSVGPITKRRKLETQDDTEQKIEYVRPFF